MRRWPTLLLLLIVADQAVKAMLPTPEWGWDPKGFSAAHMLGFAACGLLIAYRPTRLGGTIMAAGMASNVISSLHGRVANPFVVNDIAFNLADCLLLAGFVVLLCSVPAVFRCQQEFGKRRGWTW